MGPPHEPCSWPCCPPRSGERPGSSTWGWALLPRCLQALAVGRWLSGPHRHRSTFGAVFLPFPRARLLGASAPEANGCLSSAGLQGRGPRWRLAGTSMLVLLIEGNMGRTRGGWRRWGSCRGCLRSVPALLSPLCPGWRCCNASHSALCSIWGFSKGSITPKWPKIRVFLVGLASGCCRCSWLCGLQHIPSLSKQKRPALGTAALVTWCLESNSFFFSFCFFSI